ncbi:MAG: DUF3240 family protein [Burkholderiales bacterium]|nr:DUF3240 family protein [Sulfuricellaceae bacterium]
MNPKNCCLTLVFPQSLEENIVDFLLGQATLASGFTTLRIEGHGRNDKLQSLLEQVRGRARRVQMNVVMNDEDAKSLLVSLRQELGNADIVYWISPIIEFGSFQ